MKNRLYIILMLTILFKPLFSEAQEISRPEIYIENNSYDAGNVMEGSVIEHVFTVYNRGGETLNIRRIKPG